MWTQTKQFIILWHTWAASGNKFGIHIYILLQVLIAMEVQRSFVFMCSRQSGRMNSGSGVGFATDMYSGFGHTLGHHSHHWTLFHPVNNSFIPHLLQLCISFDITKKIQKQRDLRSKATYPRKFNQCFCTITWRSVPRWSNPFLIFGS